MTPVRVITSERLAAPVGYAHAVAAEGGIVFLGGQTALDVSGRVAGSSIVEQFDQAAGNIAEAMRAAGCEPADLASLQVFVTDVRGYKRQLPELGRVWRRHFGRHYPAMGLFGVAELFDEGALVELMGVAVRPHDRALA